MFPVKRALEVELGSGDARSWRNTPRSVATAIHRGGTVAGPVAQAGSQGSPDGIGKYPPVRIEAAYFLQHLLRRVPLRRCTFIFPIRGRNAAPQASSHQ